MAKEVETTAMVPVAQTTLGGLVNMQTAPTGELAAPGPEKVLVILARSGAGAKKYSVPVGSTMQDLVREANVDPNNQDIMIGPSKITLEYVFRKPELVFMVSRPKNA